MANFEAGAFDLDTEFFKVGKGSLGGKARGLAFFNTLMGKRSFAHRFEGARIALPNTTVIATDHFDAFMEQNSLYSFIHLDVDDDSLREAFLHDVELGAARDGLQRHRHLDHAREVRVVEGVRVADPFARDELDIFASKRLALARCEVPEGHLERAADLRFQMMHGAGKAV